MSSCWLLDVSVVTLVHCSCVCWHHVLRNMHGALFYTVSQKDVPPVACYNFDTSGEGEQLSRESCTSSVYSRI